MNSRKLSSFDGSKVSLCIYIDTLTHLRTARIICETYQVKDFHIYTSNRNIYNTCLKGECTFFDSIFSFTFFKTVIFGKSQFGGLLSSRVDSFMFQVIYFFLSFDDFYSFDEGLFTILKSSRYNSKKLKPYHFSRFFYWGNKLINFPKNPSFFLETSKYHFSLFNRSAFLDTVIKEDKILNIKNRRNLGKMENIFIGQPWQTMDLDKDHIESIYSFINNQGISLYLIHPREDLNSLSNFLNEKVVKVHSHSPTEDFLEIMQPLRSFTFYVVASTLTLSIHHKSKIKVLKSEKFNSQIQDSQAALLKALDANGLEYQLIEI